MLPEDVVTYIPMKSKGDNTCYLPVPYRGFCLDMMRSEGWSEGCEKCWMRILAVKIRLGRITFVVDPKVKAFDWNSLKPHRSPEKTRAGPEIFDGW